MRAVLAAEGNEDARSIIADAFDTTSRAFLEAIAGCVPGAPPEGNVWRCRFLLGALYYALINPERVTRLSEDRKSVVSGKSVSVRVHSGGRRTFYKISTV